MVSSIAGEELGAKGSNAAQEEKILVSVRLRPLNENEIARNDFPEWECINNTTVIFKNSLQEKSLLPSAYSFDRVFGCDCSTKKVYDEGAKEVALSVVSGINSSIFAYGQTSSGKTYTMRGITECAITDIYDYIQKHDQREYKLKFSAMEIYNESVRDLLSMDSTPLRLLDDPVRGTIVEKLTEETLRDWDHLKELLSICEAQRQIGETSLNEMSSRSHQILRLTIESSAREFLGAGNASTLTATVNFVDLAGSERASQTLSAGTRLKEGCHINRSLLTLGTVIRKLSKGRNAHIPYRDSKLTRILQNYLGGNARTAIICTMSPAHIHVEQSRNTLLFASCAKEVSTNAQVNVVMSEKALVKQLQKQLVRLEAELRSIGSTSATSNSADLIKQKELLIEKMDKEIRELTEQRDHAQSRVQDLLKSTGEHQVSSPWGARHLEQNAWLYNHSGSEASEVADSLRSDVASCTPRIPDRGDGPSFYRHHPQLSDISDDQFLLDNDSPRFIINKVFGTDSCNGWGWENSGLENSSEDQCKEVRCIELEEPKIDTSMRSEAIAPPTNEGDHTYEALQQKIQELQKTIDRLASPYPIEQSPYSSDTDMSTSRSVNLSRSRSCKASLTTTPLPPWFDKAEQNKNSGSKKEFPGRPEGFKQNLSESDIDADSDVLCRNDFQISPIGKEEKSTKVSGEGDIIGANIFDSGHHEVLQSKSQKKIADSPVPEAEPKISDPVNIVKEKSLDKVQDFQQSPSNNWNLDFERQRREIIQLWEECNVPLVHRTYFFLLFKGDPSDSVYMEVELRRLSFLKQSLSSGSRTLKDGQVLTLASSKKALGREREALGRQLFKRFSTKERDGLYKNWGINLNSKRRRQQLARRLWTDPKDMDHIKESAAIVARLVGFAPEAADQTPKEMFGLSFSLPSMNNLKTRRSAFSLM